MCIIVFRNRTAKSASIHNLTIFNLLLSPDSQFWLRGLFLEEWTGHSSMMCEITSSLWVLGVIWERPNTLSNLVAIAMPHKVSKCHSYLDIPLPGLTGPSSPMPQLLRHPAPGQTGPSSPMPQLLRHPALGQTGQSSPMPQLLRRPSSGSDRTIFSNATST